MIDFDGDIVSFSVALSDDVDRLLRAHLDKGPQQEDLAYAYWYPSVGRSRVTAVLNEVVLPEAGDRVLQGNVAFTPQYLRRVLAGRPEGAGVALLHSHLGPGWQGMSDDDVVAERDRLAGPVWGQSGLPVLGMTLGTDGAWSARLWLRPAARQFERRWANSVRVVGRRMRVTYHPSITAPAPGEGLRATVSVWGEQAQADLARARVGIVGAGSIGSLVAEALARTGFSKITVLDFDSLEQRNLDRTAGATAADIGSRKVFRVRDRFADRCGDHDVAVDRVVGDPKVRRLELPGGDELTVDSRGSCAARSPHAREPPFARRAPYTSTDPR